MFDTRYGFLSLTSRETLPDDLNLKLEQAISLRIERDNVKVARVWRSSNASAVLLGRGLANENFHHVLMEDFSALLPLTFHELGNSAYLELTDDPRLDDEAFVRDLLSQAAQDGAIGFGPDSADEKRRLEALRKRYPLDRATPTLLADFLVKGSLAGLSCGQDRRSTLEKFGVPDGWAAERGMTRLEGSPCWFYGCVSLNFSGDSVETIWCNLFSREDWPKAVAFSDFTPSDETSLDGFVDFLKKLSIDFSVHDDIAVGRSDRAIKRGTAVKINGRDTLKIRFGRDGCLLALIEGRAAIDES